MTIQVPGDEPVAASVEIIVHPTASAEARRLQQVVRYVEGLKAGQSRSSAAASAGTTVKAMKLRGRAVQAYLARARAEYTADAVELKELVTLQWVDRALNSSDPREALAALHELSLIPEVGLKAMKTTIAASTGAVLSDAAQAVLDRLDEASS